MTSLQHLADAWAGRLLDVVTPTTTTTREFTASATGESVGSMKFHTGMAADRTVNLVDTRLMIPHLGIDSVMLHAFAPSGTSTPHLLSDLAGLTDDGIAEWHFHVDLMPRVDVVEENDYLSDVYEPLTGAFESAYAVEGMRHIRVPPRLRSLTSGYLVGAIVRPDQSDELDAVFRAYVEQWRRMLSDPPATSLRPDQLTARDHVHRSAMFDPQTDIVWDFLADIIGRQDVDAILEAIRTPTD